MADYFTAAMGAVWLQPDGPNTEVQYLGCHDVADIVQPQGDVATRYCPSVSGPNRWEPATRTQGPPGDVTTTITTYVKVIRDYLQNVSCPVPVYVHQSMCGRRNTFNNYDSGNLIYDAFIASKTKSNTAMRETSDATEQSFDISGPPPLSEYVKLQVTRQVTTEAFDFMDIAIMGNDQCWGYCGDISTKCEKLVATEFDPAAAVSDIIITVNSGTTWTAVTGPFIAAMAISSVVAFQMDRDTTRILVSNGTTQGGIAGEVSWSDDSGTNWNDVPVLANADFFPWVGSLFAGNQYHIWGVSNVGAIWFSEDGAVTWTEQTTTNTNVLNYVHFANDQVGIAVGASNRILSTVDGGAHWTIETGPAAQNAAHILCCACLDRNRWMLGYNDGELWYTHDGGANFYQRTLPAIATAVTTDAINDMSFFNHYHGILSVSWTGAGSTDRGSYLVTHNGGWSWEIYDLPDTYDVDGTPGPMGVVMCHERLAYGVGDKDTTGTIYALAP